MFKLNIASHRAKISTSLSVAVGVVLASVFVSTGIASAHVVVRPAEVDTAARQVFTIGVPNESETGAQVVGVRLVVPESLQSARPNAKPGWNIEIVKTGEGEDAKVSEIIWSGGAVQPDQRDEFLFQAQAPVKTGELQWKAYETYSDGTVVAWEEKPSEKEGSKPYSVTKVITPVKDDATKPVASTDSSQPSDSKLNLALALGAIGTVLSGVALVAKRK